MSKRSGPNIPTLHKTTHQDAGADEISVLGLSGLLADDQKPKIETGTALPGTDNYAGRLYFKTDSAVLYRHDGSAWVKIGVTDYPDLDEIPTSFTPASHAHGNITNTGYLGAAATIPLITGTSGIIQAGSFGTAAGTFCQGDDTRLGDTRTPISHGASLHTDRTRQIDIPLQSLGTLTSFSMGGTTHHGISFPAGVDTSTNTVVLTVPIDLVSGGTLYVMFGSASSGSGYWRVGCTAQILYNGTKYAESASTASMYAVNCHTYPVGSSSATFIMYQGFLKITIRREGTNAADTYPNTIYLLGASVQYTADM